MTSIFMREKQREIRLTHKRGRQCDQEAETGVKQPQAKECQQPLAAQRRNRFSPRSAQSLSRVRLFATPRTAARHASLSITNSRSLLMSIQSVMPSNHPILCHPFSSHLQSFPASGSFPMNQFFASGEQSISFRFSISPSNEYSGLISFRMDWLDLLAVQRTLKSLLQHHSSKASVPRCSAFFIVQLSHP